MILVKAFQVRKQRAANAARAKSVIIATTKRIDDFAESDPASKTLYLWVLCYMLPLITSTISVRSHGKSKSGLPKCP